MRMNTITNVATALPASPAIFIATVAASPDASDVMKFIPMRMSERSLFMSFLRNEIFFAGVDFFAGSSLLSICRSVIRVIERNAVSLEAKNATIATRMRTATEGRITSVSNVSILVLLLVVEILHAAHL